MDRLEEALLSRGCAYTETEEESTNKACKKHSGCNKLNVYDWLADIPHPVSEEDLVEVRFKNTRKAYYRNVNSLNLDPGEMVAVESSPGHDIGMVSLTGPLVLHQLRKLGVNPREYEFRKVYRKAKPVDIDKWKEAIALEHTTMLKSRRISADLNLNMKIGDVEYQGDKTKAIFYYIADDRVDFRELIKVLADEFRIRIEMRQIGARQEAGRIGGIGPCGRELCCSSWITNFVSVTTLAARQQELSLNPQKLAGQCSKLKCCLNYEVDVYLDAQQNFPPLDVALETHEGKAFHQKTDIFKRIMWYSFSQESATNMVPVPVDRAWEIIQQNRKGVIPRQLLLKESGIEPEMGYTNAVGQDSLTRFDKKRPPHRPGRNPNRSRRR